MTTETRKVAQREASKKNREQKKASGFVTYRRTIRTEWKDKLDNLLNNLKELDNGK